MGFSISANSVNSIIHLFLHFNPRLPKTTLHYQVLPNQ
nr:MAG TPA: hypothetical protein [Caudoviricetes sp.]